MDQSENESKYVRPNAWMDPDFLETLFPLSMDFTHSRTEFTFWAVWSAPLLVSTDVCDLSDEKKAILMNKEVLAVHKDPLFVAGERLSKDSLGGEVWYRPLANGDMSVILYNSNNDTSLPIAVQWSDLGWKASDVVQVRDLWANADLGEFGSGYKATVGINDVSFLRLHKSQMKV